MEQDLYVVWYSNGDGWRPSRSMTKTQADIFAQNLVASGHKVKVAPRLMVTTRDIIEG
ncbi:hypothetical protein LLE49_12795 [Alicyclobacillus tolerans]|uniref:hypothetical protein n=1 Tax=Alicyclobacillus tolerans TaxID=90970 RepID=UPI001F1E34EB|nr:hypothetical protein [Alicyclobacillus tolerans]MCF8565596.1 hypothetical protein [Alicyclobacillus tolerans]